MKKSLLVNKYSKQMRYNKSKSLFFNLVKNVQIFRSEIGHFERDHRFLFSSKMRNIRSCKEVRLQKIQVVRVIFFLKFLKLFKNEESFGESSSLPFFTFIPDMYINYSNNICFSKELKCNKCKKTHK